MLNALRLSMQTYGPSTGKVVHLVGAADAARLQSAPKSTAHHSQKTPPWAKEHPTSKGTVTKGGCSGLHLDKLWPIYLDGPVFSYLAVSNATLQIGSDL